MLASGSAGEMPSSGRTGAWRSLCPFWAPGKPSESGSISLGPVQLFSPSVFPTKHFYFKIAVSSCLNIELNTYKQFKLKHLYQMADKHNFRTLGSTF